MPGLAESLFYAQSEEGKLRHADWPELEVLVQEGKLHSIDLAFARRYASGHSQKLAALLCHVMHSAREGHLCIRSDEKAYEPGLEELNIDYAIPEELVTDKALDDTSSFPAPTTPLCRSGKRIYLQRNWLDESLFVEHWQRLMHTKPKVEVTEQRVSESIHKLQAVGILAEDQASAIKKACQGSVTVITGGPGTGKTYTAGQLIRILLESLPDEKKARYEIALAAPTGKAAAALQKSLQSALEAGSDCQAMTLHRILGINHYADLKQNTTGLSADLVLVDECSMIDSRLMARLFASVKSGARLILLGDKDQLPPVEAGQLFHDISTLPQVQNVVASLTQSRRMQHQGLTQLARSVCAGDYQATVDALDGRYPELQWGESTELERILEEVKPLYIQQDGDAELALERFSQFRLLSPLRKGPMGVDRINHHIREEAERAAERNKEFLAPILITRNSPKDELYNGDVGILVRQRKPEGGFSGPFQQGDYALFVSGDAYRKVPALLLPPFDYAYCLSVHKSQGSEFKKVLLLLPNGSQVFGREVLYTAITRAREEVQILCEGECLKQVLANHAQRRSGFAERLSIFI